MVDRWNQSYTETLTSYAQQYGTDLENLMETMQGSTKDSYKDDIKKMAEDTTKEYLVMQVIADKEKLNVTDRDFNTALSTQAAQAGYSSVEEYKKSQDTQAYREYLMVQNVLKFLKDKVHVTAPASGSSSGNDGKRCSRYDENGRSEGQQRGKGRRVRQQCSRDDRKRSSIDRSSRAAVKLKKQ